MLIPHCFSSIVVTKAGGPNSEAREIPNTRRTAEMVDKMQQQNRPAFTTQAIYDGVKHLFTTKMLSDGQVCPHVLHPAMS